MFHWSEDSTFATYRSHTMSSSYTGLNVNGLKFGTTYYWRVYAITANYADTSASSAVWSFTTTDAPTLTGPTDGIVLTNSVRPNIRWTELVGASKYIYQCDTSSSFDSPLCLTYTYNGYNSNGSNPNQLHFGKTYYLRMKATNSDDSDTSAWSAVRTFTTCDAPTLSSPSNGSTLSTVAPTAYYNTITGANGYLMQWSEDPDFATYEEYSLSSSNNALTLNGLKFSTTYYWRVCAFNSNSSDTSSWSEVWSFTTSGAPTLSTPANGSTLTTVQPTLYYNTISGAGGYLMQWSEDPDFATYEEYSLSSSNNGLTLTRLEFGTTYYWRVCAINNNSTDTSAWSEVWSFTTTSGVPTLVSPADGYVYPSTVKPLLRLEAVTGASYYLFHWSEDPTFATYSSYTMSSSYTGLNVNGLKFGTTYYWRVFSITANYADTSASSAVWSFTTTDAPTITAPNDGTILTNSISPNIQWTEMVGATKYIYQCDTSASFNSPVKRTYTVSYTSGGSTPLNLRFGATYYLRMRATNTDESDTSAWSAVRTFITSDAPVLNSPSNGYVYSSSVNPTLKCETIRNIGKYIYQWDTTSNFNSPLCRSTVQTSTSVTVGPLKLGTTYYWRMCATNYNDSDTSSWSAVWSFTTGGSIPTLASPSNGSTAIRLRPTLQWNSVSSCNYYDYECDTTPQFNSPELQSGAIAAGTSEIRLNKLRYGTTYYWRVRIRLNSDTSSWSTVWSFTTAGTIALTSPSNGTTLYRYLHPTLDWDFINDGDYYEYQYDLNPDFDSPELVSGLVSVGTSEVDLTAPMRFGATYYWRVREYTSIDTTPWSETWSFTTPGEIALVSPANGTTNVGSSTTLDWDYIRGGTIYEYQYDVTPAFNSAELVEGSIQVGTSQVTISNLEENRLYYWRVRELSAVDTTPWSEVWHFSTRMQPIFTDVYDTACDSYTWNGQTYTQSGEYTRQFVTALQADSTVTLHLTIYHSVTSTSSVTVCESDLPYHYVNGDIDTTFEVGTPQLSTFNFQLLTQHGCDSTVILTLNVRSANYTELTETACGNYTWNNEIYEESGDYVQTFTNAAGCDSVVTLHLTIFTANYADFADNACGSYTWNGEVYEESGDYVQTFSNANGCDSVVTLHLTIYPADFADFADSACGSYVWNDEVYEESGDYVQTLTNANGCDSVVTLHLTIYEPVTELVEVTICENDLPYHYINGDIDTTFEVGTPNLSVFNFQFSTSHGCDSTVTLHLTINQPVVNETYVTACDEYEWNGETLTASGDYTTTFTAANGCDSTVTLHLTIFTANYADFADSACGSYTWNGEVYEESGDYVQTFTNANGCDSTVTLHLTIYQSATETVELTICESDLPYHYVNGDIDTTFEVGTPVSQLLTFNFQLLTSHGCDSVVTLHLTIYPAVTELVEVTLCENDLPYHYVNGDIDTIFEVGTPQLSTFNFQLLTQHGCDSVVTLHLTIEPCDTNGINENGMANLTLYPNPTTGMVNVQFTMNNVQSGAGEIQVLDVYGRVLDVVDISDARGASVQTVQIDLSHYATGVYFVRMVNGGKVMAVRKVVKEK